MSDTQATDMSGWIGRKLVDADGDKIGTIDEVYVDEQTGEPQMLAVTTGLFGTRSSFVPLAGSTAAGDDLQTPYAKSQVKDAPNIDVDGALSPDEEDALYRHYGLTPPVAGTPTVGDPDEAVGHDVSGPNTDSAMTRSEEELQVGVQQVEAGRVRLRKYVVTEHETVTVPVKREEVRLEREPITEANVDAATSGAAISSEEHEVVLHEERPVVETEVVAKERVRLDTETVTEQQTVEADVRKEQIELEGDEPPAPR